MSCIHFGIIYKYMNLNKLIKLKINKSAPCIYVTRQLAFGSCNLDNVCSGFVYTQDKLLAMQHLIHLTVFVLLETILT